MKIEYYNFLIQELKLEPSVPSLSSNIIQDIKCLLCNNIFKAIPKGKVMNYKKYKNIGCSNCTFNKRYKPIDDRNKQKLIDMGFTLHQPYINYKTKILVSNKNCCDRKWCAIPANLLDGFSICKPCNDERKRKMFQDANITKFNNACARLFGWNLYRLQARHYSEVNYRTYKHIINPNDWKRIQRNSKTNIKGYHLDHIIPISYCFKNNIPVDICAHQDNLQMLEADKNAQKYSKLPNIIPNIFKSFLHLK